MIPTCWRILNTQRYRRQGCLGCLPSLLFYKQISSISSRTAPAPLHRPANYVATAEARVAGGEVHGHLRLKPGSSAKPDSCLSYWQKFAFCCLDSLAISYFFNRAKRNTKYGVWARLRPALSLDLAFFFNHYISLFNKLISV